MSTHTHIYWLHCAQGAGKIQEQSTPVGFEGMHRFLIYDSLSDDTVTVYITPANWDDRKIDQMIGEATHGNPRGDLVAIGTMSVNFMLPEHPREQTEQRLSSNPLATTVRRVVDWCSPHYGICTTYEWRYKALEFLKAN